MCQHPWTVCCDTDESIFNTELNLRKYLVISVPLLWEFFLCFCQMCIYTVRISGANSEWNMQSQNEGFSDSKNPLALSGHRGDGKAGKHHPEESLLWISPALPLMGTSGSMFALHTFFRGHTKPFLRKMLLLEHANRMHFTSPWAASATAKCLRVSRF